MELHDDNDDDTAMARELKSLRAFNNEKKTSDKSVRKSDIASKSWN